MNVRLLQVLVLSGAVLATSAHDARDAAAPPPLTIAQLQYDGGGDWYANPSGLPNLLREIRDRTGLAISITPGRTRLTDPSLWSYPYLYLTGHGNIRLSEEEVRLLRRYLLGGGFVHVDDNFGLDDSFRREVRRVFPDRELEELPPTHPVFNTFYNLPDGLPKIHRHSGRPAQAFGIFDAGRLVLFYSYESDLGNGWEDVERYDDPPQAREAAFRMGVNLFMYALSQVAP
ncbi:MAG TPA: DUF4159 domain-containing protein [Longimicrobiales bacterium]